MDRISKSASNLLLLLVFLALPGCQLYNNIDETAFCCRHYTFTKITDYKNTELDFVFINGEKYYPSKGKESTFIEFHYNGTFIQQTTFKNISSEKTIKYTTSGTYYQKKYKFYLTSNNNNFYYGIDRPTEIDDESSVDNVSSLKVQILNDKEEKIDDLYIWYYDSIYHGCDY